MDNKTPSTYNDLNFAKLSQALKSNIARRKTAKKPSESPLGKLPASLNAPELDEANQDAKLERDKR